jgi:hypothetical protein
MLKFWLSKFGAQGGRKSVLAGSRGDLHYEQFSLSQISKWLGTLGIGALAEHALCSFFAETASAHGWCG